MKMNEDIKDNEGKTPLFNLFDFPHALEECSKVREFGNKKYPDKKSYLQIHEFELKNALIRHLNEDAKGELLDKETEKQHLAHLVVNGLMILESRWNKEQMKAKINDATKLAIRDNGLTCYEFYTDSMENNIVYVDATKSLYIVDLMWKQITKISDEEVGALYPQRKGSVCEKLENFLDNHFEIYT